MVYCHDYDKTRRRARLTAVRCGAGASFKTSARPPCWTFSASERWSSGEWFTPLPTCHKIETLLAQANDVVEQRIAGGSGFWVIRAVCSRPPHVRLSSKLTVKPDVAEHSWTEERMLANASERQVEGAISHGIGEPVTHSQTLTVSWSRECNAPACVGLLGAVCLLACAMYPAPGRRRSPVKLRRPRSHSGCRRLRTAVRALVSDVLDGNSAAAKWAAGVRCTLAFVSLGKLLTSTMIGAG